MDTKDNSFLLTFQGGLADQSMIDLYDAGVSYLGLARTLSIIGHFYVTGRIIYHAPKSKMPIYVLPPEDGSFKQTVAAGAIAGIIAAPFGPFVEHILKRWLPEPSNPQMEAILGELRKQTKLQRLGMDLQRSNQQAKADRLISSFANDKATEIQVLRSVTSNSFKNIFFPIGRSADFVTLQGGTNDSPFAIVDITAKNKIEADEVADTDTIVVGIVNSFSRTSKTGIIFSDDYGRGFRFEYNADGKLPLQDDFSWSQYSGKSIRLTGRFVLFFDGNVKKFLVYHVERVSLDDD